MSSLNEQVLEHIECSHAALDAANAEMTKVAAEKKAVAELIPAAVEAAIKHGRIDPAQAEKMASMLQDPVQALKILTNLANPENSHTPRPLGKSAGATESGQQKRANYAGAKTHPSEDGSNYRQILLGS